MRKISHADIRHNNGTKQNKTPCSCINTHERNEINAVKESIKNAGGTVLYDDPANKIYPMPIITSNQDLVYVGRIRKDLINENGISIWCAGDQVRKGAATNAIQIMMKLVGLL